MISDINPLKEKHRLVIFIISCEWPVSIVVKNCKFEITWVPEASGSLPEASRKLTRKLVGVLLILLQLRKLPEDLRKLVRKLTSSSGFLELRKLPEGLRNTYRKGLRSVVSISLHRKCRKGTLLQPCRWHVKPWVLFVKLVSDFPEALRKLTGSFPEAYTAFLAKGPFPKFKSCVHVSL